MCKSVVTNSQGEKGKVPIILSSLHSVRKDVVRLLDLQKPLLSVILAPCHYLHSLVVILVRMVDASQPIEGLPNVLVGRLGRNLQERVIRYP